MSEQATSQGERGALLAGKRILVTGILNHRSIAFAVAERLLVHGAEVAVATPPGIARHTRKAVSALSRECEVHNLDVRSPEQIETLTTALRESWGGLDGLLHAVAFAPASCLGQGFLEPSWDDVAATLHVSAYSLAPLARLAAEIPGPGGVSIVALDFDASLAWPEYNWMGVAKSTLEAVARYLAQELGRERIRVNLVASGPIRTLAARAIPGFRLVEELWGRRAPLGWDPRDARPVADACVALFSDLLPMTTGEIVHVDGGAHAVGAGGEICRHGRG